MQIGREIRKTDVALTSHTLELNFHLSYSSAAVGSGQVGSRCRTYITVGIAVNQTTSLWMESNHLF